MSTVQLNDVTVYVSAIESVEDGVSDEYGRLWNRYVNESMWFAQTVQSIDDLDRLRENMDKIVAPKAEDHPAVIVKLTSGREFRIVGKTRKEIEHDIIWAKRRGHNG